MEFSTVYDDTEGIDYNQKVSDELSSEFRKVQSMNPMGCMDSFEASFWMHCETVARRLNCNLTIGKNDEPCFDFVTRNTTVAGFLERNELLRK